MRTRDLETPADQLRIDLIISILNAEATANSMTKQLEAVRKYDKALRKLHRIHNCKVRPFESCNQCDV